MKNSALKTFATLFFLFFLFRKSCFYPYKSFAWYQLLSLIKCNFMSVKWSQYECYAALWINTWKSTLFRLPCLQFISLMHMIGWLQSLSFYATGFFLARCSVVFGFCNDHVRVWAVVLVVDGTFVPFCNTSNFVSSYEWLLPIYQTQQFWLMAKLFTLMQHPESNMHRSLHYTCWTSGFIG